MFVDNKIGRCYECNDPTTLKNCVEGYHRFCSNECAALSPSTEKRRQNTMLQRYGARHALQVPSFKKQVVKTSRHRFGANNYVLSEEGKKRIAKTNLERYGCASSPFGSALVQRKVRETIQERYGVDNVGKSPIIQSQMKNTCIERFGSDNYFGSEIGKRRAKDVLFDKYGVEYPAQHPEFLAQILDTSLRVHKLKLDGKIFEYQGYEKFLITRLVKHYGASKVKTGFKNVKTFWYEENGTKHRYFPDAQVGKKIYEVKSNFTLVGSKERFYNAQRKAKACRKAGYFFICLVFDANGNIILKTDLTGDWKLHRSILYKL